MKVSEIFPHEDSQSLDKFYGNPRGKNGLVSPKWFKENIIRWKPIYPLYYSEARQPLKTLLIHKLCKDAFDAAFKAVWDFFDEDEIENKRLNLCGGTYNYRLMRGGNRLSTHAYGIAIDIDPDHNPYPHKWDPKAGLDKDFVICMQDHGFCWRGESGDVDPMHFQCAYRGSKAQKSQISHRVEVTGIPSRIYNFFTSAGLSSEQACGIVANVEAESGFDIGNVGDGGRARGLFQMHPDRRDVIKEAIGIDMESGSIEDQCKGCLWELEHVEKVAYAKLKDAEAPFAAGYNFCRYYERPRSHYEWIKRGRRATHWFQTFAK